MKVLLDHNLPKDLAASLSGHLVWTARQRRGDLLENGKLLAVAQAEGFDIRLTADKKMYAQQNHTNRKISILLFGDNKMSTLEKCILEKCTLEKCILEKCISEVATAIRGATPGSYHVITVPLPPKTNRTATRPTGSHD